MEIATQHRAKRSKHVVYNVSNDALSRYDWDDPTEDYDTLVRYLLNCAQQVKLSQVDASARILHATKDLFLTRRNLRLDQNAKRLKGYEQILAAGKQCD
ncbi:unnamed protein product [Haemonchus placei]|uniref:Transposase n=1 Tax=Haemonchus placei TaxID=6290 RepID=A0A0N4W8B9_HAEPC|nr:unnamed protein product [Haemonchus placei]